MLDRKTYLGDKNNRVCRFCGRNSNVVKFKKVAHAIPEMLGNHYLCTYYECDYCNEIFSKLENDLGWFTELGRATIRLQGKYGPPTLKQGGSEIRDENGQMFIRDQVDEPIMDWVGDNELKITVKAKPYTPVAVYKAFTKMALTLMPEDELIHFKETLKWIQEQDHSARKVPQLIAFSSFISGPAFQGVGFKLLFRKDGADSQLPYCQFVLKFHNFMYQIYIPFSVKDSGPESRFLDYPPEFDLGLAYPWAEESEAMFNKNGMLLEAKKMKISKNRAKNELKEIELMERY
ncbi:hypothetical protein [Paenibacillus lautus]|uniref:hypothetical protein n=1 Tax=Paenibacillus lautus TaxID=1401 RepID=UPI003D2D909B